MIDGEPAEVAARVRAAEAYANLKHGELAAKTGIGKATIARLTSPTSSRIPDTDEREKIAKACGVPLDFLEQGFAGEDEETVTEQLARHERLILEALAGLPTAGEREILAKLAQEQTPLDDTSDTGRRGESRKRPGGR